MLILTLRTDKPEAEIGLFEGQTKVAYEIWEAHRKLAETLHVKIEMLLKADDKTWQDIQGIVAFEGPGSFTGLRIGLATANAIAASLNIPIVASKGDEWAEKGIKRLLAGEQDEIALPFYGQDVHITLPRK
jgi:tRNA threonylcarbamoyladenosine biosynthesis protein TsaB